MNEKGEVQKQPEQGTQTPTEASKAYLNNWQRLANTAWGYTSGIMTAHAALSFYRGDKTEAFLAGAYAALSAVGSFRGQGKPTTKL